MSAYKLKAVEHQKVVDKLVESTRIERSLVQNIVRFSKCLATPDTKVIDRQIFSIVLSKYFEIMDPQFLIKIFDKMTKSRYENCLSIEAFAKVVCIFCSDNIDLKTEYVFSVYDSNGDGTIDLVEIIENLKNCKVVTDVDEADKDETFMDLCTMATEVLGVSNDGMSLEYFRKKVRENILLLTILGQSLPSKHVIERFKSQIHGKSNLQMKETFGNIRQELLFEMPDKDRYKYYNLMLDLP